MHLLSAIFSNEGLFLENKFSLSSLCKSSCFRGMFSLTNIHRPPQKLSLSCLNILYPTKQNWLFRKELSILVSDTKIWY